MGSGTHDTSGDDTMAKGGRWPGRVSTSRPVDCAGRPRSPSSRQSSSASSPASTWRPPRAAPVLVNGAPALRLELDGALEAIVTFAVTQGRVTAAYIVRNPHKLHAVDQETVLTR